MTRGRTFVAVTAALFMGVLSTLAIVSPASAADEPALTASKKDNLVAAGESITVTGTNFKEGITLRVSLCQTGASGIPPCDSAAGTEIVVPAGGGITHTFTARAKFNGNGTDIDCRVGNPCAIMTSSKTNGQDASQRTVLPLTFAADPPAEPAAITASKKDNLVAAGEPITVTGTNFKEGITLRVSLCQTGASGIPPCDSAAGTEITIPAGGGFTHTLTARAKFNGNGTDIDCRVANPCAIMTSSKTNGQDASQRTVLPLTFAGDVATLTSPRSTNLVASGDQVTVNGSMYKPNVPLMVVLCDTQVEKGGSCAETITFARTDASGNFSVNVPVVAKFGGKDCRTTSGVTCGIQTTRSDQPTDRTQEAILPVSFAADPVVIPPAPVPNLGVSQTTGLSTAKSGTMVRVNGRNHARNTKLVMALCVTNAAPGKKCDTGTDKVVKTNAAGQFSASLKVRAQSGKRKKAINCVTTSCSVKVWRKGKTKDASQRRQVAVHFAGSNVRSAPVGAATISSPATGLMISARSMVTNNSGASLEANKTSGISSAGETLTVKGSGFQPDITLYLVQCDPSVAAGGSCDMGRYKQPKTDGAGNFTISVPVASKFTSAEGAVDCMAIKCALMTSKVGGGADRSQEVTLPLSYSIVTAAAAPGKTSSGKASSGKASTGKTATATATTGSATVTPQSTSTAGLPAMGAPALALPMGLGLLMMATGLFMVRRVRQQG